MCRARGNEVRDGASFEAYPTAHGVSGRRLGVFKVCHMITLYGRSNVVNCTASLLGYFLGMPRVGRCTPCRDDLLDNSWVEGDAESYTLCLVSSEEGMGWRS